MLSKPILDDLETEYNENDVKIDSENFAESFALSDFDDTHRDERSNIVIEIGAEVAAADYRKRIMLNHHRNLTMRLHLRKN